MAKKETPNPYTSGEVTTLDGAMVRFACSPDERDNVVEALSKAFRVYVPTTTRVQLGHGCYGRDTRFDITQHGYMGGPGGYVEALEIKDAPDERCGFIIAFYGLDTGDHFFEWETLEQMLAVWAETFRLVRGPHKGEYETTSGFIRRVECGKLNPWFYAVGTEELIGDFATPQNLSDDPIYRLGVEFEIVEKDPFSDEKKPAVVKTCLGCRISEYDTHNYPKRHVLERRVYFHDGSIYLQEDGYGDDFVYAWREKTTSSHFSINPHLVSVS